MSVTLTKIFLLCCLVSFSKQQLDFYELADKIGKNYNYLETKDVLSLNSSYHMAWIVGEYSVIKETFPNLPTDKLQIINDLMKKADRFIQAALEKYKDNIGIQIGLRPRTWTTAGDFSFKKGFIQEGDPINETLMEIYERSKRSKEFQECEGKFIAINKEADELRKCDLVCGENVNWTDPLSGIMSSDEKVEFLSLEILLNCSNHKAIEIKNYVAKSCSYMKRQVNEMYERRYEPEFADLRYYFLNKSKFMFYICF